MPDKAEDGLWPHETEANLRAEVERLRAALGGAARLAAHLEDKLAPDDPNPEAQTDLRALAQAMEAGEPLVLPDGMRKVFDSLAALEGEAAAREPSSEELWPFKALYFHLCDALGIEQMPSPGLIEWDTAVAQVRRLAEAAQEARDD